MKFPQIVLTAFLSLVVAFATVKYVAPKNSEPAVVKESVYELVIRTGTLRCGYFEEAPFTIVDPNTGKKSGIAVDLVEKIASELGLKVEWTSEINFGMLTEDLKMGRYDAVCASLFALPRAGRIDYTMPYTYVPVYGFTQKGRTEFDNKLDQLDWTKVSIAGIDGEGITSVLQKKYPQAKFVILPQTSQIADMLTNVVDKKADIGFVLPTVFKSFDANNPNMLQKIATDAPFHVFNVTFGMKPDEPAFKDMLDNMIRILSTNGYMDELFKKYDPDGLLFRPATFYKSAH